jgi:hypothetical protein
MQLHNPSNVKLPPLVIDKLRERVEMEASPKIYNLIKSNLLLDKGFVDLIRQIHNRSDEVEKLIQSFKGFPGEPRSVIGHAGGRFMSVGLAFNRWMRRKNGVLDKPIDDLVKEIRED